MQVSNTTKHPPPKKKLKKKEEQVEQAIKDQEIVGTKPMVKIISVSQETDGDDW